MGVSYRGGKPVSRPSPRRSIPKGGISYRGGKRIDVRPVAGVSVSKYRAVVPFMQAGYVTAGMPGMTAKSIAMFTKAATMPSQLTHSERAFVRQHMPSMKPEYRKKFVEFERELTQAELKKKLVEKKGEIARPDIRRQVAPFLPGVTPALLWGVTPETKQFAAKTWKGISEGVTPISIAKMGVAISPVGITIAPLMAIGEKMFPTIREKAKGIIEWKPKAEREYERVHIETVEEMAKWERTSEGVPITPYELTSEAKGFKRRQEELIREASERGWKTPEGVIEYPVTERGKEWASEYTEIQEIGKEYITPEGFYREEYYVPTKQAAETLRQVEWLEKRGEEMASPTFMAKERTKGMWIAPAVTKAAEFGEWWEKAIIPKVEEFGELSKSVYALQVERGAPSIFTGTMLLPKERPIIPTFQVGMAKGIPDVPIMAAEVGYGAEWIGRHPKEAAMIAPGVAAYMVTGMAKEAVTHPVEFAGRMATMAAITGGVGRVVRPVMPKYISGVKVTDTGVVTYKGLGIRGIKEPYPLIGEWKEIIGKAPKTKEMTAAQYARYLEKEGTLGGVFTWRMPKEIRQTMREEGLGGYVSHYPPKKLEELYVEYEAKGWTRAEVRKEMRGVKFTEAEHEIFIAPMHYLGRLQTIKPIIAGLRYGVKPTEIISRARELGYGRPRRQVLAHELFHIKYPKLAEARIIELERTLGATKRPFHVELVKGTPAYSIQRALVLGKEYPALRYLKGVKDVEFTMPEFGVGARVFGKEVYTEIGIGRAIKRERMRMEGLWTKDYLLAEKIAEVSEVVGMPKIAALPPPKPVLWERVGPIAVAERITALMKTKPIKEWGIRVEKPIIPTYEELAAGRAYRITMGYDAFQVGQYPKYLKVLGLDKGIPTFAKGIEKIIHPFREKVPGVYEPSMLDYPVPKGLLTEGLTLDISRAKIRPTERVPSPIEKLYERVDIYREFGVERRPITKELLKPIGTRYLKWTAEGELIPQPEMAMPEVKPKRRVEVIARPEVDLKLLEEFFGKAPVAPKEPLFWMGKEKPYVLGKGTPSERVISVDVRLDTTILDRLNKLDTDIASVCSGHPHPTEVGQVFKGDIPEMAFWHPRAGRLAKRLRAMRGIPRSRITGRGGMVIIEGMVRGTPEWWEGMTTVLEQATTRKGALRMKQVEAVEKVTTRERVAVPFISTVPVSIFEQVEKEREKYIPFPHIPARAKEVVPMVSFKDITAMFPEAKPAKKEKPVAFILPTYEPAPFPYPEVVPKPFEEIKFKPMPEPVPEPVPELIPELVPEPKPFEIIKFRHEPEEKIFVPPPPPDITFLMPGEERKPRKRKKRYRREEYPWKEKHYIPTLQELMRQAPGQRISKSKAFIEPKMPKLPKGIM